MTEKDLYQAQLFANRLSKQYRRLRKWARKNRITCYRLYDRDIPEVPLACDLYTFTSDDCEDKLSAILALNEENAALSANDSRSTFVLQDIASRSYIHLYLYERPYEKDAAEEEAWLEAMAKAAAETVGIEQNHVIIKTRRRQSADEDGKRSQYQKTKNPTSLTGMVQEQGQLFAVNLTDYIDTGLFFDHRVLRNTLRSECKGKRVLNLFCYTGSFSVYAAEGLASYVESVDLSNTYLDWAKKNMKANGFSDPERYVFTRQDVLTFLSEKAEKQDVKELFDIIILDPPTFSNSKKTEHSLDINKDWPLLVEKCLTLLSKNGILYFSTNSRRLTFNPQLLPQNSEVTDITERTIPEDYRNTKIHRVWLIRKS